MNLAGEDIGEIEELALDLESGQITYAILSFGAFLGIGGVGDKLFAVPWVSLRYDEEGKVFVMKVNKELLEKAPGFDKENWPDLSDPTARSQIYAFYGAEYI